MEVIVKKKISPLWFIIPLSILALGFLCYVPFWINSAYLKGGEYKTVWNGSEFLAFYGAALSAIGALFLGVLSIWQNKQIQKTNEEAQKRLEAINKNANEINIINKFVERENKRIENLSIACDTFAHLCLLTDVAKLVSENKDLDYSISQIKIQIFSEHQCIGREMSIDLLNQKKGIELLTKATTLYDENNKFFERLLTEGESILDDKNAYKDLSVSYSEFVIVKDDYLVAAQENINSVLFGEISLSELRLTHHYGMEVKNGQDEDAE